MGWFTKEALEMTEAQKIAWLITEKDKLLVDMEEAQTRRARQKQDDLQITRNYEAIVAEMKTYGINA